MSCLSGWRLSAEIRRYGIDPLWISSSPRISKSGYVRSKPLSSWEWRVCDTQCVEWIEKALPCVLCRRPQLRWDEGMVADRNLAFLNSDFSSPFWRCKLCLRCWWRRGSSGILSQTKIYAR